MRIISIENNNSSSFKDGNRKNKVISILVIIFLASALLLGIINYTMIQGLNEDLKSTKMESTNAINSINEDVALVNSAVAEVADSTRILNEMMTVLQEQQAITVYEDYDFLVYSKIVDGSLMVYVKSGSTGGIELEETNFSNALEYALDEGKIVVLAPGSYELDSNVSVFNKSNMTLDGKGSTITSNGYLVSFAGNSYENNSNILIRNLFVDNGGFRLENVFRATFENIVFENCDSAVEILNSYKWSEATIFQNIFWENCLTGITVKAHIGNGTSSYENTELSRCFFNLNRDNAVAIFVEKDAYLSNGLWSNVRIWMHANETQSQTGLKLEGAMENTVLNNVVFESFGNGTIYGISLGKNSTYYPGGEGPTFLWEPPAGFLNWIYNPEGVWIPGLFKKNISYNFTNTNDTETEIHMSPLRINNFQPFINISNLNQGEEVTVIITLNFIDSTNTSYKLPPFLEDQEYWLTAKDLFRLYPANRSNELWNIVFTVETTQQNPYPNVHVGVYGRAE